MIHYSVRGRTAGVDAATSYSSAFIKHLMNELDSNGDGELDFDEFVRRLSEPYAPNQTY